MTVNHSVIFLAYHSLISLKWHSYLGSFLPSVMKLRQGNVFTPVCQSFHSQGTGCLADTSLVDPGQTPPVYTPQVDPPRQTPHVAWTDTPTGWADTPTRWADTPWADTPQTDTPTLADGYLQRMVRIQLECILVVKSYLLNLSAVN